MSAQRDIGDNTVLAVLAEVADARACLDAAHVASQTLENSEVAVLHIRVDPFDDIMPTEEILTSDQFRQMQQEAARESRILHDVYLDWVRTLRPRVPTRWIDVEGAEAELVKAIGSQAVLNVIINPETSKGGHTHKAFHACIFDTHRPLLLVPRSYRPRPLRRVLIGWRDTPAARRAMEGAIPWLKMVDRIVVLSVGCAAGHTPGWVENFLQMQDLRYEIRDIQVRQGMTVGAQILREARVCDADWLLTGAFRYGEVIEWIFGGVTEDLLKETMLPIFMRH